MSYRRNDLHIPAWDFMLELAKGNVPGHALVNVQGRAVSGAQTTATDIWDRADATPTQQTLTSPTAARVHALVSGSASDDGDPAGVGAQTVTVYGLTSWSAAATSETVTLNGTNSVNTTNSYVHINKLKVATSGATNINVGAITATAATDSTVSAHIIAGNGETQMAIYALPSTQTAYIMSLYGSLHGATAGTRGHIFLKVNYRPSSQLATACYHKVDTLSVQTDGSGFAYKRYPGFLKIPGPAIIKLQVITDINDVDTDGGFDLILVDN